jgi:signal transduction histidine kinase/DNA-binding response OmpR family regulator
MKLKYRFGLVSLSILAAVAGIIALSGVFILGRSALQLSQQIMVDRLAAVKRKAVEAHETLVASGVAAVKEYRDETQKEVLAELKNYRFGETGQLFVLSNGKVLLHPNLEPGADFDLPDYSALLGLSASSPAAQSSQKTRIHSVRYRGEDCFFIGEPFPQWGWDLVISMSSSEIFEARERFINATILTLAVGLAAGSGFLFWFANGVTSPLQEAVAMADAIAKGNIPTPSANTSKDEAGTVLAAFNCVVDTLRARREEETEREWLRAGLAEMDDRLRGDFKPAEVASIALSQIVARLDIPIAAIYMPAEGCLRFAAGHAVSQGDAVPSISLGEGLVGQCAQDRRPLLVEDLPQNALRIASGLCLTPPKLLFVAPLLRHGELAGVIELGMLKPFTPRQREYLDRCIESASAAFLSAISRERVNALLQETRLQASKLHDQQEEIQVTNEELREHNDSLVRGQAEIRRKNEELELARSEMMRRAEELERANRYKSEFLANMSHELRTPLNSMLILSHLLADDKTGKLDAKQVEFAKTINKSGSDLLALINDILDLSKVEAGKMEFHIEDVSLGEVAVSMENLFRHPAEHKGLVFAYELDPAAPSTIRTDGQRLQQVIKNLIGNALKFTERGSVTLRVTPAPADSGMAVALTVTDTGIGIPTEKQAAVFEAFRQADGSTNRRFGGTGLGLSISRELIQHLGGTLRMESVVGVGSSFSVLLPAVVRVGTILAKTDKKLSKPPTPSETTPEPDRGVSPPATRTAPIMVDIADDRDQLKRGDRSILIVEDDVAFARILVDLVRSKGFGALWADDGVNAFRLAKEYMPTGIFLDVMLPGMDGWAVMQMLKDESLTRHIPVHFISCLDRALDGLRMGAIGYLTKPVTVEQLQQALARIEEATARRARRLLVVEDVPDEAHCIVELLASDDVEATTVASGQEAIRVLSEKPFDCVVLDLGLKDMSGFDFLEHVRSRQDLTRLPIIIHTGHQLSPEEELKLRRYTETIIVKGAKSPERLLDEATLFLHLVEERLPEEKQRMLRLAHDKEAWLSGKKILLVDDDMRNVFSLTSVLEGFNVEVIPAIHGEEALTQLEKNPDVNLVLMDIMMPGMDGYQAIRAIRAQDRYRTLPVIALTAKAMRGDRDRCIQAGANDYLSKPVDVERLLTLLHAWILR